MKNKILYNIAIGFFRLFALLPLFILYGLSDLFYVLIYYIAGYRKKVVRINLERAFPDKTEKEKKIIEKKFYRHFCDCIVETLKLLHISDKQIKRRVRVTNPELIEQMAANGRPIVLFLGHYGNWEWAQAISMYYKEPRINGQIYRPLRDKVMDRIMLKIRSRFDTVSIPQKRALKRIFAMRNAGEQFMIGFISDQRPNSSNMHYWTKFLGIDTPFSAGGEMIGEKINAQYVYLDVEKLKRGHYRMTFREIIPENTNIEYPYTREFMRMFEATIYRAPQYWLWSHNKWSFYKKKRKK